MLAPVAQRQAALEKRFPTWEPRRLDQVLDAAAAEFGDRDLVVTDGRTFSYAEIADWSVRVANGLVAAGVRPGEHVAMVSANLPEFVALKFGIARAGAVCIPVNFLNRRDELGYVLDQSDAVALVTMDRFRDLDYLAALDALMPGWESAGGGSRFPTLRTVVLLPTGSAPPREGARTFDQLAATAEGFEPVTATGPHDTADILYTSGTTGTPKGVLLTHDMLLRTAYGSAYGRAFQDGRRITFSLPMYHVYGYVEGLLAVLFAGGAIVPQLAFSPAATLDAISRHRCDDVLFIPTMTAAVLDHLDTGVATDLSSLTSMISSGGVAPTGIWDRIEEHLPGVELTTGYGMSEVTASSTVTRPDDPPERRLSTNGRLRDVGVAGDPALGGRLVEYKVVDAQTRADVAVGGVGELLARGPGVTSGYYRKPEETDAAFADGSSDGRGAWLRTGDLGRLDADDYLTLVGRVKESYRCGGEQVMPKEIEDVLTGHPSVGQAHVVPLRDERMGEVGVAWIVARPGTTPDADELVSWCRKRLARFKVPRHVLTIEVADIPTTPSGRPRKFLLAELAAQRLLG
ncbi:class I adenylate-forming enzyme family protein [Pseudonocardia sp. KRD291]|uniref:class I adenylate-forming enzyme family protein n=1 Tax=Pseudonocardia sp. KRD291 TaxID=2792007 RepID=UPI001C4A6C3D|nr:AMP-binding protein [Pseudonocardia sp. KRD291]MBW0102568.1 AMP-binding protein [Pseudonocardia sp. KRD291]